MITKFSLPNGPWYIMQPSGVMYHGITDNQQCILSEHQAWHAGVWGHIHKTSTIKTKLENIARFKDYGGLQIQFCLSRHKLCVF